MIYHIELKEDLSRWAVIKFELEDSDPDYEALTLKDLIGDKWEIMSIAKDWSSSIE